MITRITFWLTLLLLPALALGQQNYQADASASKIMIHGTSNIHDWSSWVEGFTADASLEVTDGILSGISSLSFRLPVENIKSGNGTMDNNTYKALKASSAPHITYRLTRVNSLTTTGDRVKISATGTVSIAGKERSIPLTVYARLDGNTVTFSGKTDINMVDYGVEPPTALFGTISTGEAVTIEFTMVVNTQSNSYGSR